MSGGGVHEAFAAVVTPSDAVHMLGRRDFSGVPQSVGEARRWVSGVLSAHASDEVLETVVLLVSEVVTNAIVHSDSGRPDGVITVGVGLGADLVYVEVVDEGSTGSVPVMRPAAEDCLSGRGLNWVNSMSQRWGTGRTRRAGRVVWFQVASG